MTSASVFTVGLLGWAVSFLVTAAIALLIAQTLRTNVLSLDAAALVFLWIWVTTLLTMVFGLAGGLSSAVLGWASAAGLAVLVGLRATRRALWRSLERWREGLAQARTAWTQFPRWMRWMSLAFFVFAVARFALLIWALPPFVWDSLTYHLTNVAQWIQDGRIGLFRAPVERIYLPANYEVLAAWFSVFLHHDVLIEAAGLPAYALAGLSVYSITRACRVSPVGGWASSLAYLSTPALVLAVTGTKNDPFVAATYLLLVALVIRLWPNPAESRAASPLSLVVLTLLGLSYALGTKAYILHLSPGLVVVTLLPGVGSGLGAAWTQGKARLIQDWRRVRTLERALLVGLVGVGLFIGGYWNVRNWALTGNPFYPYEVGIEAETTAQVGPGRYGLGLFRLEENLSVLAEKFGDKQERVLPDLPRTTGWGWLSYGMGLPASVWAFARRKTFRGLAIAFGVSMIMLMASNTTSPWNMRYFLWLPALFAVGLGAFLDHWSSLGAKLRWALVLLFGFGLGMNSAMTWNYGLIHMDEVASMMARPFQDRQTAFFRIRVPYEYENALLNTPDDAVLGYNVHSNGFIYPLFRADFSQRVVYIPIQRDSTCTDIAQEMRQAGARHLATAPEHTDDLIMSLLHDCGEDASVLQELGAGLYVLR